MFPALILTAGQHRGQNPHPSITMPKPNHPDSDIRKGAVEEETSKPSTNDKPNLHSQQGHRDQDELLKDADTDFPEPGSSPEHSGERR
jgi:hypothetical protein